MDRSRCVAKHGLGHPTTIDASLSVQIPSCREVHLVFAGVGGRVRFSFVQESSSTRRRRHSSECQSGVGSAANASFARGRQGPAGRTACVE